MFGLATRERKGSPSRCDSIEGRLCPCDAEDAFLDGRLEAVDTLECGDFLARVVVLVTAITESDARSWISHWTCFKIGLGT